MCWLATFYLQKIFGRVWMMGILAATLLARAVILHNGFFPFVGNHSVGDTLGLCSVAYLAVCLAPPRHGLISSRGLGTKKPLRTGSSGARRTLLPN